MKKFLNSNIERIEKMTLKNEQLAKKFSSALLEEIGVDNLREVNRLNAAEPFKSICHSNDFTDANQVFLDSIDPNLEIFNDIEHQWTLISEIWGIAKSNNFYIKEKSDVIMFCPVCLCIYKSNDEMLPYKSKDYKFNESNQYKYDNCDCGADFIYLDEISKIDLLMRFAVTTD